ncbi:MAG TPA: peptide ABC transporter substrate-binding protein, partial [Clostridiales bacterium]|nr:peptide ABC transporter substrate-binding protein [Clostridiales bacterium]
MTKFRLLLLLAVLLLLSSLATGCQTGRRNLAADQSVVCNLGVEPPRLNSAATAETVAWDIIRHTLEGLVSRDNNDRIVAGMAESWDISDDGLVYTFYLRDAQWSNGTAVAAADFVFALKTVLNPDAPSPYAHYADPVRNAREFRSGTAAAGDLGIEAIDEKTLKITLEQATGYFLD